MTITVTLTLTPSGQDPLNSLAKVVTQVECSFTASDGTNNANVFAAVTLETPNAESFKPADSLTPADLLGFVAAAKGDGFAAWRSNMEAMATAKLTAPKNFTLPAVAAPAS